MCFTDFPILLKKTFQAGLFLWADFSHYMESPSVECEMALFKMLFEKQKLYIVPGSEFGCLRFGWFRLIFAVGRDKLETALDRLALALA